MSRTIKDDTLTIPPIIKGILMLRRSNDLYFFLIFFPMKYVAM